MTSIVAVAARPRQYIGSKNEQYRVGHAWYCSELLRFALQLSEFSLNVFVEFEGINGKSFSVALPVNATAQFHHLLTICWRHMGTAASYKVSSGSIQTFWYSSQRRVLLVPKTKRPRADAQVWASNPSNLESLEVPTGAGN
jgi:hypothetical protein